MTIFRVTQKLQKEMGLKAGDLESYDESAGLFDEWYVNVFFLDRIKHIIFVEKETLFYFTLERVARKDLRGKFSELFEKGLEEALYREGASAEIISAVLEAHRGRSGRYAKTINRQTIAAMNELVKRQNVGYFYRNYPRLMRDHDGRFCITKGVASNPTEYMIPMEVFTKALKEQFGFEIKADKENSYGERSRRVIVPGGVEEIDQKDAMIFEITLPLLYEDGNINNVVREVAVSGQKSLSHLAEVILESYDFDCDHCYGFFDDVSPKPGLIPEEVYELFVDLGGCESPYERARGVKKTKISDVFREKGKSMRFLFDYGDSWEFIVTLKNTRIDASNIIVPAVLKRIGIAPEQYPEWDEA